MNVLFSYTTVNGIILLSSTQLLLHTTAHGALIRKLFAYRAVGGKGAANLLCCSADL